MNEDIGKLIKDDKAVAEIKEYLLRAKTRMMSQLGAVCFYCYVQVNFCTLCVSKYYHKHRTPDDA